MTRFVMANRRAGKFKESEKTSARAAVGMTLDAMAGAQVSYDSEPPDATARRIVVFDAEPSEVAAAMRSMSPDVIIEPEILHWPSGFVPLQFQLQQTRPAAATPFPTGIGNTLRFNVKGNGSALEGADIIVTFRAFGFFTTTETKTTGSNGKATFTYSNIWTPQTAVIAPAGDFWTMVEFGPSGSVTVDCPALPTDGPIEWWHEVMGSTRHRATRGKGIRVGVCDTGVGPNGNLDHVTDVGAFINNTHLHGQGADVDAHGSHVCGIIGARPPAQGGEYAGVAPGVDLLSARVFGGPNSGAGNADIANAIDALSRDHKVDLINLSLGAKQGSAVIQDSIQDALERGTLCICAAGNSNGAVEFPGAFDESVAVAALGLLGWGPPGSLASLRLPSTPDRFADENLYHTNFSCFGEEITCTAPGAGYISTVPERFGLQRPYSAFGGTSMASPAACALTAALLAESKDYKSLPRDLTRSGLALKILKQSCRDIGLAAKFQGAGLPTLT